MARTISETEERKRNEMISTYLKRRVNRVGIKERTFHRTHWIYFVDHYNIDVR